MSPRPFSGERPCFSSYASINWSARQRLWQFLHSVSGSVNVATWPDASHTCGARITDESIPTTSSRPRTTACHHCRRTFSLSSTPSGP